MYILKDSLGNYVKVFHTEEGYFLESPEWVGQAIFNTIKKISWEDYKYLELNK